MTPAGTSSVLCASCGLAHPASRRHCGKCGRASLFIDADGLCVTCTIGRGQR